MNFCADRKWNFKIYLKWKFKQYFWSCLLVLSTVDEIENDEKERTTVFYKLRSCFVQSEKYIHLTFGNWTTFLDFSLLVDFDRMHTIDLFSIFSKFSEKVQFIESSFWIRYCLMSFFCIKSKWYQIVSF